MAVKKPASSTRVKSLILDYEKVWNNVMTVLWSETRSDEDEYQMREMIRHMQLGHERMREWYQQRAV
jgi:hypothetical protein